MKQFQKRLDELLKEVIIEVKSIGIPISDNIDKSVLINKRAKSRFGACKIENVNNKKHFKIEIRSALYICEDFKLKEVLAHEVLHTCRGCANHGETWKRYAKLMNDQYGYNIKRVANNREYDLDTSCGNYKYKIICNKCGKEIYRQKKTKVITNIENYRCKCGGKLRVEKI